MPTKPSARIQDHVTNLTDPRRRKVTYPLVNIVTIAICVVICGADDFVAIAKFGRGKREWLAQFLDLSNGIPSHDRSGAIFAAVKRPSQNRPLKCRHPERSEGSRREPQRFFASLRMTTSRKPVLLGSFSRPSSRRAC
jgi:hypothetical protein